MCYKYKKILGNNKIFDCYFTKKQLFLYFKGIYS